MGKRHKGGWEKRVVYREDLGKSILSWTPVNLTGKYATGAYDVKPERETRTAAGGYDRTQRKIGSTKPPKDILAEVSAKAEESDVDDLLKGGLDMSRIDRGTGKRSKGEPKSEVFDLDHMTDDMYIDKMPVGVHDEQSKETLIERARDYAERRLAEKRKSELSSL